MSKILPFQNELYQVLPVVIGNVEYNNFKALLFRVAEIIDLSGIEKQAIQYIIDEAIQDGLRSVKEEGKTTTPLSEQMQMSLQEKVRLAIRVTIARKLTRQAYRPFSVRLAESQLLQHFCLIDHIDKINVPSKSTLERYEKMFPEKIIREMNTILLKAAISPEIETEENRLKLEESISLDEYFADSTAVKAHIHYPVDWVLLRDATRTIMQAVKLIRDQGLKNRMEDPADFIKAVNRLCIEMTHTKGKKDSKKKRKKIYRLMKKLLKKVALHGLRHQEMLKNRWEETDLSENEADQIIARIENILTQLPEAIRQGHERIIGERLVKNEEKILSLYDKNIHVIVRGKAGAKIEFGNTLFLAEQADGLIPDWKLYQDKVPADSKILKESIERLEEEYDNYTPLSATTDRGFFSKTNQKFLKEKGIKDYMCPKSVSELQERLQENDFCEHQKRRAQTEGRIGIIKNSFLGNPSKGKSFNSRNLSTAWSVLSHNLWVLARLPEADVGKKEQAA
jgi:IS5 family transposase